MKFRPGTDEADYQVKMRKLVGFLEEGDRAKVSLRFRGREMLHQELGRELLARIRDIRAGERLFHQKITDIAENLPHGLPGVAGFFFGDGFICIEASSSRAKACHCRSTSAPSGTPAWTQSA